MKVVLVLLSVLVGVSAATAEAGDDARRTWRDDFSSRAAGSDGAPAWEPQANVIAAPSGTACHTLEPLSPTYAPSRTSQPTASGTPRSRVGHDVDASHLQFSWLAGTQDVPTRAVRRGQLVDGAVAVWGRRGGAAGAWLAAAV